MRRGIAVALVGVVAAGVTALAAAAAGPSPGVMQGAPGIAVAGGAHIVTTAKSDGTTLVRLVRDRDGTTLRSRSLEGKLGVPLITFSGVAEGTWANGRRLVLASSIYDDRSFTTFVTLDTRTLTPLRTTKLRGSFAFDALSPTGKRLYVLQFSGGDDLRYSVRSLSMATGRLAPGVIVDKRVADDEMTGEPMGRAWSRDGTWAYTLYRRSESFAFVHALDTRHGAARCLALPWRGDAQRTLGTVRIAVRPSGDVILSQPGVGVLARIDTTAFRVDTLRSPKA